MPAGLPIPSGTMNLPYAVVDVFARGPFTGNPLAVVPDGCGTLDTEAMQRIAREMNLSETTFVEEVSPDGYRMRIFTPFEEMPFAGHPTLGTAWLLRRRGMIPTDRPIQRTAGGETPVSIAVDTVWFERSGRVGDDRGDLDEIVEAIGADAAEIGFDAAAIGMERILLAPASSDAGVEQLMVPLASPADVEGLRPSEAIASLAHDGVYCFAPLGPGRVKARFFAPGLGVFEDPATGSAAAALGLYLAARAGDIAFEIEQGIEIGRPSRILCDAARGRVRIGGACELVAEGVLHV